MTFFLKNVIQDDLKQYPRDLSRWSDTRVTCKHA